jgi:MFS family permease
VVTAYVLASMTMVPIIGKLSDQFGRKWFLLGGTALFLFGSGLSGASQTMDQLILFRAMQGVGAGMGMALVATVFGDLFEPAAHARTSRSAGSSLPGMTNSLTPLPCSRSSAKRIQRSNVSVITVRNRSSMAFWSRYS